VEGSHVQTRVPLQESLRLSEARRDETQRPSDLGYVCHPGREDDGTTAPPCRDEEWCEGQIARGDLHQRHPQIIEQEVQAIEIEGSGKELDAAMLTVIAQIAELIPREFQPTQ